MVQILIVEDEVIVAMSIKSKLIALGHSILAIVRSGEDALKTIELDEPDIVIMDIVIKGTMNGVEVVREINRHYDIPIIYLAAHSDEQTLAQIKQTRVYGYLKKPFDIDELGRTIENALYYHQMEQKSDIKRKLHAQIEEQRHKLADSKTRYNNIFDYDPNGLFISNEHGDILEVNNAASRMTGYSKDELLSMKHIDLIPPEHKDNAREHIDEMAEKGQTYWEGIFVKKDGNIGYCKIKAVKISHNRFLGFVVDMTRERIAEQKAHQAEQIINNSPDILFKWKAQPGWPVEYVSKNISKLGYSANEMIDGTVLYSDLIHPMDIERIESETIYNTENHIDQFEQEYRLIDAQGYIRWFNEWTLIIRDADGSPTCYHGIITDITIHKKTERALLNAKLTAEAACLTKSEFLANMNHELRTPLNAVIGFSDVLLDETFGELNTKQRTYLKNVLESGKHLLHLISDILDLSKIEVGGMEMEYEKFSLVDVINEVKTMTTQLAGKKNIVVETDIDPCLDEITADLTKVKEILYNLVENAIKFTTNEGSVTVKAIFAENLAQISVTDTGIGISNKDMDKLFKPFMQVDGSTTREYGGTGLGLMLVKEFVGMHNGEVWVESEPTVGSTFTFTIPSSA